MDRQEGKSNNSGGQNARRRRPVLQQQDQRQEQLERDSLHQQQQQQQQDGDMIVIDTDGDDFVSPQGPVNSRTRSARKRKLLLKQPRQPQQPVQLNYREEDEVVEEPPQKRVRQSSTSARRMEEDEESESESANGNQSNHEEESMSVTEERPQQQIYESKMPASTAGFAVAATNHDVSPQSRMNLTNHASVQQHQQQYQQHHQQPFASQAQAAFPEVEAAHYQQGPPMMFNQRLRLPSQQTPGKSVATQANTAAHARMLASDQPRLVNPNNSNHQQVPLPLRGLDFGYTGVGNNTPLAAALHPYPSPQFQQQPYQQHSPQFEQQHSPQYAGSPYGMRTSPPQQPSPHFAAGFPQQLQQQAPAIPVVPAPLPMRSPMLHRTWVWFILVGLLQGFFYPYWIHPIMTNVVAFSNDLLVFYQKKWVKIIMVLDENNLTAMMGLDNSSALLLMAALEQKNIGTKNDSSQEFILALPPRQVVVVLPNETALEIQAEHLQLLQNLRQDLAQRREDLAYDMTRYQHEQDSLLKEILPDHLNRLKKLSDRWSQAEKAAREYPLLKNESFAGSLEEDDQELIPEAVANFNISTLQETLGEGAILDVSFLASWKLPPSRLEACGANATFIINNDNNHSTIIGNASEVAASFVVDPTVIAAANDTVLKAAQLVVRDLKKAAAASAMDIMTNQSIETHYRLWVSDSLLHRRILPEYKKLVGLNKEMSNKTFTIHKPPPPKKIKPKKPNITLGATQEAILKTIAARMEVERADQTGRIDYASILNGAAVIRVGERRTSPSLVDRLPVGNRIADLLSLRHYGYGPEAALTPSHPPFKLGHCWAFLKDEGNKLSAYATLSFTLAKMIEVQSVSVEHTAGVTSAIRTFRVMGFEDPYAMGKNPWQLGAFQYKLDGELRQEFQVRQDFHGVKLPPLQSISVLIDANWGESYGCLYRFRVFGKEIPLE